VQIVADSGLFDLNAQYQDVAGGKRLHCCSPASACR